MLETFAASSQVLARIFQHFLWTEPFSDNDRKKEKQGDDHTNALRCGHAFRPSTEFEEGRSDVARELLQAAEGCVAAGLLSAVPWLGHEERIKARHRQDVFCDVRRRKGSV